jgi:hypothetical protein
MFVTSRFVFLHQPKTGGTFVSAILARLHEARGDRVTIVHAEPGHDVAAPSAGSAFKLMIGGRHQHGRRADVPASLRDHVLVATMRNPYDRYASQFEFAWWRRHPEMFGPVERTRQSYPRYPELTFDDFVRLTNAVSVPACPSEAEPIGFHTYQFIESFARDPDASWRGLCDGTDAGRWAADTQGVAFLDQSHLNRDLHAFLLGVGYPPGEVAFVEHADRIWPPEGGRTADQDWRGYYSPEMKAYVRRRERLLFARFPQFDV